MNIKKIIAVIIIFSSLSACVTLLPRKKYDALKASNKNLESKVTLLTAALDSTNAACAKNNKLLTDTISRLRRDTSELNASIAELNKKLTAEKKSLQIAKLDNDESQNKLLRELEQLQSSLSAREKAIKEAEFRLSASNQRANELQDLLNKRVEATNALKETLSKALFDFQKSGLTVTVKDGKVYVSLTDKLLFASGSIEIDEKGKYALQEVAKVLKTKTDINVLVEGHTDDVRVLNLGQIKDNWDLSVLRATAVARYLTDEQKLETSRVIASGRSQYLPLYTEKTTEARSKNRRIELILTPKLDELYNILNEK